VVPLKPLSFSKRDTLSLGRWKANFCKRPKDYEIQRLQSRRSISLNLFSDSIQSIEELLRKSTKVKRGATLEEADIDGAWLTAYAQIAKRSCNDKDLGVSRCPYEIIPGVSRCRANTSSIASGESVGVWSGTLSYVRVSSRRLTV
jgi:hypothetical protein